MAKRPSGGTLMTRSRGVGPEQKAIYHNELGAGRSRVVREFLGLTPSDEADVVAKVETWITQKLDTQFR